MTGLISEKYIEREYKQAVLEFKCAHTDEEQWQARKSMAKLEQIAMQEFGFGYADELEKIKTEQLKK